MSSRLSRRSVAHYVANQLVAGRDNELVIQQLAAYIIELGHTKDIKIYVRDIEYELSTRGIVTATVWSATALTEQTKKAVTELITRQTAAKTIDMREYIDKDLIGGIKIDIPGRQFDQTIARQLQTLVTNNRK